MISLINFKGFRRSNSIESLIEEKLENLSLRYSRLDESVMSVTLSRESAFANDVSGQFRLKFKSHGGFYDNIFIEVTHTSIDTMVGELCESLSKKLRRHRGKQISKRMKLARKVKYYGKNQFFAQKQVS